MLANYVDKRSLVQKFFKNIKCSTAMYLQHIIFILSEYRFNIQNCTKKIETFNLGNHKRFPYIELPNLFFNNYSQVY